MTSHMETLVGHIVHVPRLSMNHIRHAQWSRFNTMSVIYLRLLFCSLCFIIDCICPKSYLWMGLCFHHLIFLHNFKVIFLLTTSCAASCPCRAPTSFCSFLSHADKFPNVTHRIPPVGGDWPWFPWGGTAGHAHSGCRGSWRSWAGALCWCRARCRAPPCSCGWCPGTSSCPIGRQKAAFKQGPTHIWICIYVQGDLEFQVPGRPSGHTDKLSYKYTERRGCTMAG